MLIIILVSVKRKCGLVHILLKTDKTVYTHRYLWICIKKSPIKRYFHIAVAVHDIGKVGNCGYCAENLINALLSDGHGQSDVSGHFHITA